MPCLSQGRRGDHAAAAAAELTPGPLVTAVQGSDVRSVYSHLKFVHLPAVPKVGPPQSSSQPQAPPLNRFCAFCVRQLFGFTQRRSAAALVELTLMQL